jgi:hypothetical protein
MTVDIINHRFQTAEIRKLLPNVCQSPLDRSIEHIDSIGIITLTDQDNRLLLIFRKSIYYSFFRFRLM